MARKPSERQMQVLAYIQRLGGCVTARQFADLLAGETRTLRAMFRDGLVQGDGIPAQVISLTDHSRRLLTQAAASVC